MPNQPSVSDLYSAQQELIQSLLSKLNAMIASSKTLAEWQPKWGNTQKAEEYISVLQEFDPNVCKFLCRYQRKYREKEDNIDRKSLQSKINAADDRAKFLKQACKTNARKANLVCWFSQNQKWVNSRSGKWPTLRSEFELVKNSAAQLYDTNHDCFSQVFSKQLLKSSTIIKCINAIILELNIEREKLHEQHEKIVGPLQNQLAKSEHQLRSELGIQRENLKENVAFDSTEDTHIMLASAWKTKRRCDPLFLRHLPARMTPDARPYAVLGL